MKRIFDQANAFMDNYIKQQKEEHKRYHETFDALTKIYGIEIYERKIIELRTSHSATLCRLHDEYSAQMTAYNTAQGEDK